METRQVDLDEALKIALDDINRVKGFEHIDLINKAYQFLKNKTAKS